MSSPEWHDTPKWPEYADFNRRALSRQPSKLSQMSLADVAGVGPGSGLHRTLSRRCSTVGARQCCGQAALHLPPHRWHLAHDAAPHHACVLASPGTSENLGCCGDVATCLSEEWLEQGGERQTGAVPPRFGRCCWPSLLCLALPHQGLPCLCNLACQPSLCLT